VRLSQKKKKVRKAIIFTIALIKNPLGINLTKVKDFYDGNYKALKKEIEKDRRLWKDFHVHGSVELMLLNWPYY
jgi:hypothetical protein